MENAKQKQLFERAKKVLPGGFSRTANILSPHPVYIASGSGSKLKDIDGKTYTDFLNNYGCTILGHANKKVVKAIQEISEFGINSGQLVEQEVALAEEICKRIKSAERVKFINTGTEAIVMALMAARAFTKKSKVAKMEGVYHGWTDFMLLSNNSKPESWGKEEPVCALPYAGASASMQNDIVLLRMNQIEISKKILDKNKDSLAAIIIDKTPMASGFVPCHKEYLQFLRDYCDLNGIVLIFDEVFNSRLSMGGSQQYFGVYPDLTILGKYLGGGLPFSGVAGKANVLEVFNPYSPMVSVSGTFTTNPVGLTAALTTLSQLNTDTFDRINKSGDALRARINEVFHKVGIEGQATGAGSMFVCSLKPNPIREFRDFFPEPHQAKAMNWLRHYMIQNGIMVGFNVQGALSTELSAKDLDLFIGTFESGLKEMKKSTEFKVA